jgi:phosphatidylserine/phosphatidylglycerophosphate/cardiolipin synthase-like enzyme
MRFRSELFGGYRAYAITGVNTISFAIDRSGADVDGLLGFAVERIEPARNERYFMPGYKVFPSVIPFPDASTVVSTFEHPVQSFVWDDFTGRPDSEYTYLFHPLKGTPKNLDRTSEPISITVHTEPLFGEANDVFFNRGVTGSQAYAKRFHNLAPDAQPTAAMKTAALQWLSRDLDEALVRFIRSAQPGDALRGCFYEFRFAPIADEFRAAIDRGVDVRIIVDAKDNGHPDGDGNVVESFPRVANLQTIAIAGLPDTSIVLREARSNHIAHNKFIVLLKGQDPTEVWTGSTNLSEGGLYGQANVGHWVRDAVTAGAYLEYWTVLSADPGGRDGDALSVVLAKNKALRTDVEALAQLPATIKDIPQGITPVFSPRLNLDALDLYVSLMDDAQELACGTLAFGIGKLIKERLVDHTPNSALTFLLLEKEDAPTEGTPFLRLNSTNNVYEAFGAELRNPIAQWVRETNNLTLGLNLHVVYMHCKFLLSDPLGDEPIVVTGSANFSEDSTKENDENMLVIRGDRRVADIYFTEFNRLFNHYYFRSVVEVTRRLQAAAPSTPAAAASAAESAASLLLAENGSWLQKYAPGSLRQKRVDRYVQMGGVVEPG